MVRHFESDIANAIENRKSLLVQRHSLLILIEPHLFGMNRNYEHILFGYQTNGEGRGYAQGWVCVPLKEISNIYITERRFYCDYQAYEANKPELQIVMCQIRELPKTA